MNRNPIYNIKNSSVRCISVPGGLWQLQHFDGSKGSKTHDPWYNVGLPTARPAIPSENATTVRP